MRLLMSNGVMNITDQQRVELKVCLVRAVAALFYGLKP